MTGLPWDDPDRDIGADLVETAARWIAAPAAPDERDAQTAAAMWNSTFKVSKESVDAAIKSLTKPRKARSNASYHQAMEAYDFLDQDLHQNHRHCHTTEPAGPAAERRCPRIDLTRRRPLYGNRITHHDLDVDQARIAAAFEDLRDAQPPTGRAPHAFLSSPDVPKDWHQVFPSWPKGSGKTEQALRELEEFERVYGKKPIVVSHTGGEAVHDELAHWMREAAVLHPVDYDPYFFGPAWAQISDVLAEDRAEEEQPARWARFFQWSGPGTDAEKEAFRRERLGMWTVIDEQVDELAGKADVPRDLLRGPGWPDNFY